jgi:hypothetical protein
MSHLPFSLAEKAGARLTRLIPANRKPNRENRLRQKPAQCGADGLPEKTVR